MSRPRKSSSKTPSQSSLKKKADILSSAWVKRKGKCLAKGYKLACGGRLECCHLKSRGEFCIRHDPDNMIPMCHVHHRHFTLNPDEWYLFIESLYPGRWQLLNDRIIAHRVSKKKIDYAQWITFYESHK